MFEMNVSFANLLRRSLTGAGIVAVIVVSLLVCEYIFVPVMAFAMVVSLLEFYRMTMPGTFKVAKGFSIIAALMAFTAMYLHMSYGFSIRYLLLAIVPMLIVLIASLYIRKVNDFDNVAYLFTSQVYITLPFTLTNLLVFDASGNFDGKLLLGFFVVVWAADVGAYVFGSAFGQKHGHKLMPSVSPKKSWEGVWGGLFTAMLAGAVMKLVGLFDFEWWVAMVLTALLFVFCVYGDLIESKMKRHFEVKDSGNILPGHGGMLDRFDGALIAFPVGTVFLIVFNLLK